MHQNGFGSNEQQHVATVAAAYLSVSRGPLTSENVKELIIDIRRGFEADITEATVTDEYDNHFEPEPQQLLGKTPARKLTPKEIQATIRGDRLICLEDGKPYVILKTPLRGMGMTFEQYRMKWGLPYDYPSVAPDYSASRKALAIAGGLGRQK